LKIQEYASRHEINMCTGKTVQITIRKVVILGNSHIKGSVPRIGNYLSAKFEYIGFIKPFTGIEKYCGKGNNGLTQTNKKWCACAQWWG
jgi:hypothetical protein